MPHPDESTHCDAGDGILRIDTASQLRGAMTGAIRVVGYLYVLTAHEEYDGAERVLRLRASYQRPGPPPFRANAS